MRLVSALKSWNEERWPAILERVVRGGHVPLWGVYIFVVAWRKPIKQATWGTSTGGFWAKVSPSTAALEDVASTPANLHHGDTAVLGFHYLSTNPNPKDGHWTEESLFPVGLRAAAATVSPCHPAWCEMIFIWSVDSCVSGTLRIKRLRNRPTMNISNLVTKMG